MAEEKRIAVPIGTAEEKLGEWKGIMHTIAYSLPSERKKKYWDKMKILFQNFNVQFKDAILDIILEQKSTESGNILTKEEVELNEENWKWKNEKERVKRQDQIKRILGRDLTKKEVTLLEIKPKSKFRIDTIARIIYDSIKPIGSFSRTQTINFEDIMKHANAYIKDIVKAQEIDVFDFKWIVDLFQNYIFITADMPLQGIPELADEGGIDTQLKNIEEKLNSTAKPEQKREWKEKKKELQNRRNDLWEDSESLILNNYKNYYEWDILTKINQNLSLLRQSIFSSFKKYGARTIDHTMMIIEDSNYAKCIEQVKAIYDRISLGLNRYMKFKYLQWLNDKNFIESSQHIPRESITTMYAKIEKRIKNLADERKKKIEAGTPSLPLLDEFGIFQDIYPDIEQLWNELTDEDVEKLAEVMNGKYITVEKRITRRGAYKSSIKEQVHWMWGKTPDETEADFEESEDEDEASGLMLHNPKIYPYSAFYKHFTRAEHNFEYLVTIKTSMLLHEISDDLTLNVPSEPKPKNGWEAMWYISFTHLNNQAHGAETKARYIEIFKVDRKGKLQELGRTIMELEQVLTPEKIAEKGSQGVRRRINNLASDFAVYQRDIEYFDLVEKAKTDPKAKEALEKLEPSSWLLKYDDTRKEIELQQLKDFKSAIQNLQDKLQELAPKPEAEEEEGPTEKPEEKLIIPKFKDIRLNPANLGLLKERFPRDIPIIMREIFYLNNMAKSLIQLGPMSPESPEAITKLSEILKATRTLQATNTPPKGEEESDRFMVFKKKGKVGTGTDFLAQIKFFEEMKEKDKKNHSKMQKLVANLITGFLTLIKNLEPIGWEIVR